MPEWEYDNEDGSAERDFAPRVYALNGEDKGRVDETHLAGSGLEYGMDKDKARAHARHIRTIVELVGEPVVTTDAIRYIRDGLRKTEPGDALSNNELRDYRNYVRESAARFAAMQDERDEPPRPVREMGDLTREVDEETARKGEEIFEYIINYDPRLFFPIKHRDCTYDLLERKTKKFVEIQPVFERVRKATKLLSKTDTAQFTRELKNILKHSAKSDLIIDSLGLSSSINVDTEQGYKQLEERIASITSQVIMWTVTLTVRLEAKRRFEVTEKWGWMGTECPIKSYTSDINTYTLEGDTVVYRLTYRYHDLSVGYDLEAAKAELENRIDDFAKQEFLRDLRKAGLRWMPELPFPDGYEPDFSR